MAEPRSTSDDTIDLIALNAADEEEASSRRLKRPLWQRLWGWFWVYTERYGRTDTTSYKGLL